MGAFTIPRPQSDEPRQLTDNMGGNIPGYLPPSFRSAQERSSDAFHGPGQRGLCSHRPPALRYQLRKAEGLVVDAQRQIERGEVGAGQRSFIAALKLIDGAFGLGGVDKVRAACNAGLAQVPPPARMGLCSLCGMR